MFKSVGVVYLHGMGETPRGYSATMTDRIIEHLNLVGNPLVEFKEVVYSDITAPGKTRLKQYSLTKCLKYPFVRNSLIGTLADPASVLNHNNTAAYNSCMLKIRDAILAHKRLLGDNCKIVLVAHSLGCQIASNFLWDAQHGEFAQELGIDSKLVENVSALVTFGCNIPLFNLHIEHPVCFAKPHASFRWINYYSKYDVLGYPLKDFGVDYHELVEDRTIKTGLFTAHSGYWKSKRLAKELGVMLETMTWG